MATVNLKQQFEAFKAGRIIDSEGRENDCFNFYDWFCKSTSLERKSKKLYKAAIRFCKEMNVDLERHYVFFKNNCPMFGPLYDDFRICDLEEGNVVYNVTLKSGHSGEAEVYSRETGFNVPVYQGPSMTEFYKIKAAEKAA
jgi:hypothetical protein